MKRLSSFVICIVMIMGMLVGCANKDVLSDGDMPVENVKNATNVLEANTAFAFDVFKQLNREDKQQNIFISPLSISTALSMTYQGAGSTTKEAMAKALRYDNIDIVQLNDSYRTFLRGLNKADKKVELNIGNSIWIREGQKIKNTFISINKDVFGAKVSSLDFAKSESAEKINKWISNSTKGKIPKMIDSPISEDVIMYLINAIYFKGQWTNQFDKKNTFDAEFHPEDGKDQTVKMMSRNGKVAYGQEDGYKAVRLPYGKGEISMYCVLPDEGVSINEFIGDMGLNKWKDIKKSIAEKNGVILQIPRFKMEYGVKNLNNSLSALGMGEAFSDKADFSGIGDNVNISRVLHKAVVEVNEEGSEAAGVTAVEVQLTSAPTEPISFIANRPFLFVIADDVTGSILFVGKLSDVE